MTRRTAPRTVVLVVAAAALLGVLATRSSRANGDEKPLLLRLADGDDAGHEKALDEWKALSAPERAGRIREGLRSKDPGVVLVAAGAADADYLSLDEIRIQMDVLARQPDLPRRWRRAPYDFEGLHDIPLGSREVPVVWQTLAALPDVTDEREFLEDLHRATLPEHLPALVPLLEKAGPEAFVALLWNVGLVADHVGGDAQRDLLAKALLYGLVRLRAERAGEPRPKWDAVEAKTSGPGLPPAFVTLARATWGLEKDGFRPEPGQEEGVKAFAPWYWLGEWARDLRPTKDDVPFLHEVAWSKGTALEKRAWAIRALAALAAAGDEKAKTSLAALAREDRDPAVVCVAAEEARRGRPEAFREHSKPGSLNEKQALLLEWDVDPASARKRWLAQLQEKDYLGSKVEPLLAPLERAEHERDWDIRIAESDLRWIGDQLLASEAPTPAVPLFFGQVAPDLVGPAEAAKLAAVLTSAPEAKAEDWDSDALDLGLARLHAFDPAAAVGVMRAWADSEKNEEMRARGLADLALVGDVERVDAIVSARKKDGAASWTLGRVHHARMEEFLKAQAAAPEIRSALEALKALAVAHGLPETMREVFEASNEEVQEKTWDDELHLAARRQVLQGDPIGAVVRLAEAGHGSLAPLGLSKDPRALDLLRKVRRDRFHGGHPEYWQATAGLAVAGDPEARVEFEEFLRDGRTWMLDAHSELARLHAGAYPNWAAFWAQRLGSNCCTAFHAYTLLASKHFGLFPTMPIENVANDGGLMRRIAETWLARHQGSLVWSPLLDGFVPSR